MTINRIRLYLICVVCFLISIGCDEEEFIVGDEEIKYEMPEKGVIDYSTRLYESVLFEDGYYHDIPINKGVQNVVKRVDQFMKASWVPSHEIPKYPDGYYSSGKTVYGIPYSFGAESDGVVGLDVSLDTFLSAVANPFSCIYTEDIRKAPYKEILAGPYYGVVCSSAVAFFLGADFHYVTYLLDTSPWFVKLPQQDPEQIRVGDVIWKENHVMLIYDILRDNNNRIVRVIIAEGNIPVTRCFSLSFEEFKQKWIDESFIIYCYTDIGKTEYTPSKYVPIGDENNGDFNVSSICTARGDRVCFRKGECVVLNSISSPSCALSLYKEGLHYGDYTFEDHHLSLEGLEPGSYSAYLGHETNSSNMTSFCVVDYDVQLIKNKRHYIRVSFHSENAKPCYVALCNEKYRYISVFPLSEEDIKRSYVIIPFSNKHCYVRVFFDGEFGRISSVIQQIPS